MQPKPNIILNIIALLRYPERDRAYIWAQAADISVIHQDSMHSLGLAKIATSKAMV